MINDSIVYDADFSRYLRAFRDAVVITRKLRESQMQLGRRGKDIVSTMDRQERSARRLTSAQRRYASAMSRSAKRTRSAADAANQLDVSWTSVSRIIAGSLISRAIAATTNAFIQGLDTAREYTKAIATIQTIDKQGLPFQKWSDQLLELSNRWGLDAVDQAQAAYQALSNQVVDGAEAFQFMEAANQLAVTSISSTEDAVKILSSAINAFSLDFRDSNDIAAKLFKTVELGRNKIEEIAPSFGRVSVPAAQLNVKLEELLGSLATLTRQGVRPQDAMTQLNGIFIKLLKPTTQMKEFIAELGFESAEAAIKVMGFIGFLEALNSRVKGSSAELAKYINRQRGLRGVLALTGDSLVAVKENVETISDSFGSYDKRTALVMNNSAKQFEIMRNQVSNAFIQMGQDLLQTTAEMTSGFKGFGEVAKVVARLITYSIVPAVGLLTAALVKFAAASVVAAYSNPFTAIIATAGLAIGGVIALTHSIESYSERVYRLATEGRDAFLEAEKAKAEAADETHKQIIEYIDTQRLAIVKANRSSIRSHNEFKNRAIDAYNTIASEIDDTIKDTVKIQKDFIGGLANDIRSLERDLKRIPEVLASLSRRMREDLDEISGSERNAAEQLSLLHTRLNQTLDTIEGGDFANLKELEDAFKRARDYIFEIDKIQDDTAKKNTQRAKSRKDLEQKIRDLSRNHQETLQKLEAQKAKASKSANDRAQKLRDIQGDIRDSIQAYERKLVDLREEYNSLNDITIERLDAENLIKEAYNAQRKALGNLAKAEEERLRQKKASQKLAAMELAEYEALVRRFPLGDRAITGLFDIEDPSKLREQVSGRLELVDKTLATLGEARQTDDIIQKQEKFVALREQLLNIETKRLKFLEEQAKVEAAEASVKALEDQAVALKQLQENFAQGFTQVTEEAKNSVKLLADFRKGMWIQARSRGQIQRRDPFTGRRFIAPRGSDVEAGFKKKATELQSIMLTMNRLASGIANAGDIERAKGLVQKQLEFMDSMQSYAVTQEQIDKLGESRKLFKDLLSLLTSEIEGIGLAEISKARKAAAEQAESLNEKLNMFQTITTNAKEPMDKANTALNAFNETLSKTPQLLTDARRAVEGIQRSQVERRAVGGGIYGTDKIPTMLSPGEFVVNANAAQKFRGQLMAANSGIGQFTNQTTVGDINISLQSSGSEGVDVRRIGEQLRSEIRRGRLSLQ